MFIVNSALSKPNIPRTIRFTEEIYSTLQLLSEEENISFNALVLQCCKYAMDSYGKLDELQREKKEKND